MTLDPALSFESARHNMNTEMRLAAGPMAGVTLMKIRLVGDIEAFRRESLNEFLRDVILDAHGERLNAQRSFASMARTPTGINAMSRLEA